MIRSFAHKGLAELFLRGNKKKVQAKHVQKLLDILDLLDAAHGPKDMNFPGADLHPLKGALKGFWAVRVSGNWRVVFRFEGTDVYDINYLDYH